MNIKASKIENWNDEMFSVFQCKMGLIFSMKTGKNTELQDKYVADAQAQMTENEFAEMMKDISRIAA